MGREGAVWREIRRRRYDVVVNLTEGDRGAIAGWISGARVRVGVDPGRRWIRRLYTHVAKGCPGVRHRVERDLDVVRRIGLFPGVDERALFYRVDEGARQRVRARGGAGEFVLLHPASRWKFKCWPAGKMRELAQGLVGDGRKVVVSTGPDREEVAMGRAVCGGIEGVVDLSGALSLDELGALIDECTALVCVDSVPLHLASALSKPVVALFGPTSEGNWGPWENLRAEVVSMEGMRCRPCYLDGCGGSKRSDCLERIEVERVREALERVCRLYTERDSKPKF
jgi:heptosyltransferase-3